MGVKATFSLINSKQRYWKQQDKVLLAVSGGVDSMVLLELFATLPEEQRPFFGVAHVNHQLRAESVVEADYLKAYCREAHLPYYEMIWQRSEQQEGNTESAARDVRYTFFSDVAKKQGYDCVVTAHHADDQAETILMKLTMGTQLKNLVGIRGKSQWKGLVLYRPLLAISKEELRDFAAAQELLFFEDATNMSDSYFRNRVRHQIVPSLKQENANFLKHIHSFVKQIEYATDIVDQYVSKLYLSLVTTEVANQWQLDLVRLKQEKPGTQYLFLVYWWQEALVEQGVVVNDAQVEAALTLFQSSASQGSLNLADDWVVTKSYDQAFLTKGQWLKQPNLGGSFFIRPEESLYLSDTEWLGLERSDSPLVIPEKFAAGQLTVWELGTQKANLLPLKVRRRKAGDRFVYNQQGQTKKVSRLLIDEKIPHKEREKLWVLTDFKEEVLGILPIRKSYLSINKETDKIHYRLIFLKIEQDLEGDSYVGEGH